LLGHGHEYDDIRPLGANVGDFAPTQRNELGPDARDQLLITLVANDPCSGRDVNYCVREREGSGVAQRCLAVDECRDGRELGDAVDLFGVTPHGGEEHAQHEHSRVNPHDEKLSGETTRISWTLVFARAPL
jgi:hypothetical protein